MLTAIRVPAGKGPGLCSKRFKILVAMAVAEHNLFHKDATRMEKVQQGEP